MKNSILTLAVILLTSSMINAQPMGGGFLPAGGFGGGFPSMSDPASANNDNNMSSGISLTNTTDIYQTTLTQFLDSATTLDEKSGKQLRKLVERENEYNNNIISTLSGGTSSSMISNMGSMQIMGDMGGFDNNSVAADSAEIEKLLAKNESQFDKKYRKLLSSEQYLSWEQQIISCRQTFREQNLNNKTNRKASNKNGSTQSDMTDMAKLGMF